jgi:hypothetical protein
MNETRTNLRYPVPGAVRRRGNGAALQPVPVLRPGGKQVSEGRSARAVGRLERVSVRLQQPARVGYDPFGLNNFGGPIQPRPSRDSYIKIYRDAARTARQEFPDPPDIPPGMESAARSDFRHCLAACELSRQHSHLESKIRGDLNECIHGEDPEGEDLFDKAANEVGRRIADKAESREDCVAGCRSAARLGRPFSPPVPSSWP